jgi:hypothetical protein
MALLAANRWVFLIGSVFSAASALGACGGDEDGPLDDPMAGKSGGAGDSGTGGSGQPTGGRSNGGSSGKGTAGSGGRAGSGSVEGGADGEAGEAGAGGQTVEPPETCNSDEECAPAGMVCDPVPATCVACFFDTNCDDAEVCRDATCVAAVSCESSLDCGASEPICDTNNGRCVQCLAPTDCPANNDCTASVCVPYSPCENSLDCSAPEVCDTSEGRCFECVRDADCGTGGRCVDHDCRTACASDNACTPDGMLCNLGGGYCVNCLGHADCPSVYHCDAGECVRDLCAAGSRRCEGNAVATCNAAGDGYDLVVCGARQTCVADGPDTACQDWVCTAGELECDVAARTLVNCSADGLVASVEEDCDAQGFVCYEERCQDLECVPSARYCEGETVRQCAADGNSSTLYQTCSTGQFCSDETATCTTQICTPNEPWCNGTRAQVCNARGSGSTGSGTDCRASDGRQCVDGACECVANQDDCDGEAGNGCETNTSTDPDACGGCDDECSNNHISNPTCASSVCNGTCQSGYADCNSDKLSDGCEANLANDPDNCNVCDRVCSANHVAPRCTAGVCDGVCAGGYADCNSNKQTDGCETALDSDPDHCGGCTTVCSSAGMATRTCNGSCNGTCNADFLDCNSNKQTDGCEVNRLSDEAHCGDCETACSDGEFCINGECGDCNNRVLFLADDFDAGNDAMEAALIAAGLDVHRIDSSLVTYTGTPAASGFGAVLIPVGNLYSGVAPAGYETSILTAHTAGTGVLFTAWAGWRVNQSYWSTTFSSTLIITTYRNGITPAGTYTLTSANHPIWAGLPTSFTAPASQAVSVGQVVNGGTIIATCSGCAASTGDSGAGVVVREPSGSEGRVVDLAHSANYLQTAWYSDTNMMTMFTNAAKWATRCN